MRILRECGFEVELHPAGELRAIVVARTSVAGSANGTRYDPIGLPPAFRSDGRRVVVTLRFTGNPGSFCMVGELARVVDIRDR